MKSDDESRGTNRPAPLRADSGTLKAVRAEIFPEGVPGPSKLATPLATGVSLSIPTPQDFIVPSLQRSDRSTLTILNGVDAGRSFTVATSLVIGRDKSCDLCLDDDAVSRRHATVTRSAAGTFILEDLGSTNGTFVGAAPVKRCTITSGDRIHIGPHVALRFATTDETEDTMQRRLYETSTRDALTGLLNRAALTERLAAEVAFTRRTGTTLWLLMLDLDRFKHINDTYGHLAGDQILRTVAQRAVQVIRVEELFARYGGEEFVVVSRGADHSAAAALAERLRQSLQTVGVTLAGKRVSTTVSIGGASLTECETADGERLLALADRRLYAAKSAGRNRVCLDG
jgi:two-component system cell cycle response regulator